MNGMVRAVKQAALEAVRASGPAGVCFGTVVSVSPLKIQVDQKMVLEGPQLLLTDRVRDYSVEMTPLPEFHETEPETGGAGEAAFAEHKHKYRGRKKWRVHNALAMGEKVLLLRCDGGQQYVVWDRWEARA